MGAVIGIILRPIAIFLSNVAMKFVESLYPFVIISLITSLSICVFIIGGVWGPFISIMFIYILLFKRLKHFWKTGLYLNTSVFK